MNSINVDSLNRFISSSKEIINIFDLLRGKKTIAIAIDWSDIYGYCFPLLDSKNALKRGDTEYILAKRARLADWLMFSSIPFRKIILKPHVGELYRSIMNIQSRTISTATLKNEEISIINHELENDANYLSPITSKYFKTNKFPDDLELIEILKKYSNDFLLLMQLFSGDYERGIIKLKELLKESELQILDDSIYDEIEKDVDETRIMSWTNLISRNRERRNVNYSNYTDAYVMELIKQINSKPNKYIDEDYLLFFTRSSVINNIFTNIIKSEINDSIENKIDYLWNPDDLITFEIYRENTNWEKSYKLIEEFCIDSESILQKNNSNIIYSHDNKSVVLQNHFTRYLDLLDEFENLRLIKKKIYQDKIDTDFSNITDALEKRFNKFLGFALDFWRYLKLKVNDLITKPIDSIHTKIEKLNIIQEQLTEIFLLLKQQNENALLNFTVDQNNGFTILYYPEEIPTKIPFNSREWQGKITTLNEYKKEHFNLFFRYMMNAISEPSERKEEHLIFKALVFSLLDDNAKAYEVLSTAEELNIQLSKYSKEMFFYRSFLGSLLYKKEIISRSLEDINKSISIEASNPKYLFMKAIILWLEGIKEDDNRKIIEAIKINEIAYKNSDLSEFSVLRYMNNELCFKIDLLLYFYDQFTSQERISYFKNIEELFMDLIGCINKHEDNLTKEVRGDVYHTIGKYYLIYCEYISDVKMKKDFINEALNSFRIAKKLGINFYSNINFSKEMIMIEMKRLKYNTEMIQS